VPQRGGKPLFGIPFFIDYPRLLPEAVVGNPEMCYLEIVREDGEPLWPLLYPFRSLRSVPTEK
jgi:hypothetical protein